MLSWWLWLKLCAWGWFTDNWCLFVSLEVQRACYLHTSPISAVDSNSAWVRTCRRFGRKKKLGHRYWIPRRDYSFMIDKEFLLRWKHEFVHVLKHVVCDLQFHLISMTEFFSRFFYLLKPTEISIGNTCVGIYTNLNNRSIILNSFSRLKGGLNYIEPECHQKYHMKRTSKIRSWLQVIQRYWSMTRNPVVLDKGFRHEYFLTNKLKWSREFCSVHDCIIRLQLPFLFLLPHIIQFQMTR